jgi:hypothetical protein
LTYAYSYCLADTYSQTIEIQAASCHGGMAVIERNPLVPGKTPMGTAVPSVWANHMLVVPDPVRSTAEVGFTLAQAGDVSLALWDISGQKVRDWNLGYLGSGFQTPTVNLQSLPSGIYLLTRLEDHGAGLAPVETVKLAIVH